MIDNIKRRDNLMRLKLKLIIQWCNKILHYSINIYERYFFVWIFSIFVWKPSTRLDNNFKELFYSRIFKWRNLSEKVDLEKGSSSNAVLSRIVKETATIMQMNCSVKSPPYSPRRFVPTAAWVLKLRGVTLSRVPYLYAVTVLALSIPVYPSNG